MNQPSRKNVSGSMLAIGMAIATMLLQLWLYSLLLPGMEFVSWHMVFTVLLIAGGVFLLVTTNVCRQIATDTQTSPDWLQPALKSLTRRMHLPEPELHTLNTTGINAFALQGLLDNGHVLINNATLTHLHEDEIEAVLAHECSHIARKHALALTLIQGMTLPLTLPIALLFSFLYAFIYGMENFRQVFLTLHQILTVMFFPLTSVGIALFTRVWELDADRHAACVVGKEKYIAALKCLHGSFFQHPNLLNPGNKTGQPGYKHGWALSHPSLAQRINALLEIGQP